MAKEKICLLFLLIPCVSGFNVGIKGAKVLSGDPQSMHGYSLDFATKDNNVWLLVGSPKARDPDIAQNTGTVQYCGPSLGDCKIISVTRLAGVSGVREIRSEMWLGASVDVGNAVSFCGPRWMRDISDDVYTMNGLCYEVPFGFLGGDNNLGPIVLDGLYNSPVNEQFTGPDASKFNQTIKYGLSSSGTAIKYFGEDLLVGSPGLNEFAGGYVYLKGRGISYEDEQTTEAKQGQMYGYALATGQFYGDSVTYFVSGGPRDGGSGKVLITDTNFVLKERLSGVEPGSYFGSVLCVVPASANGFSTDILVVGAPSYSNMQTYANNYYANEEQGRVYVYQKSGNDATLEVIQTLEGSKSKGARFGFAMANLNDFNKDGYNDLVVGAPFEEEDKGAVYVYMGYKRGFYQTQKIFASDLDIVPQGTVIKTFGSAFTQHPADFNSDQHADLAVGAYKSDKVYVLYTNRPITMSVATKTDLTETQTDTFPQIIPLNRTSFTLKVCFDYEGENIPSDVEVIYEVTADTAFLESSGSSQLRVCFSEAGGKCVSSARGTFKIFKAPAEHVCTNSPLTVLIKDNWDAMRSLFEPVVFDVEFNVTTSGSAACTTGCPVVNKFNPSTEDPFAKARKYSYELARGGCGPDNICQSDLKLTVTSDNKIVTGQDAQLALDVTVLNSGEPSYTTEIAFTFHPNLTFSAYTNTGSQRVSCSPVNSTVICSTEQQKFPQGNTINFKLILDGRKLVPVVENFPLKVEVKAVSRDPNLSNNMYTSTVAVLTDVKANFFLIATPEVYITKPPVKDKPTIDVVHNVQMVNTGPSDLLEPLTFTFNYPQCQQVKPLSIVLNVSSATDDTVIRCQGLRLTPAGVTNSTFRAYNLSIDTSKNSRSANNFNCLGGGTCSEATCTVGTFLYNSFISVDITYAVDANLYNLINDQDSGNLAEVPIVTKFTPESPSKANVKITFSADGMVMTRILPSKPVEEDVPVWAIVVPILVALIILGVVIFVLWKKGFFVRKYKVQMAEQRAGEAGREGFDDIGNAAAETQQEAGVVSETRENGTAPAPTEEPGYEKLKDATDPHYDVPDSQTQGDESEEKGEPDWAIENGTRPQSEETILDHSNGEINRDKDKLL